MVRVEAALQGALLDLDWQYVLVGSRYTDEEPEFDHNSQRLLDSSKEVETVREPGRLKKEK